VARTKTGVKKAAKPTSKAKSAAKAKPVPKAEAGARSKTARKPSSQERGQAQGLPMPILYKSIEAIRPERHAGKSLRRVINYAFAASGHYVPLAAVEFATAAVHYPIVFTGSDPVMPIAVLGLEPFKSLFVSEDGVWETGCYVPAYVRRYPFILIHGGDTQKYALCVDETSGFVYDGDDEPIFQDGKPTEIVDRILDFCTSYQRMLEATRDFGAALKARGLLMPSRTFTLPSGRTINLGDFQVVNGAKFHALPEEVFLDWRQRGWLAFVHNHLVSLGNWKSLGARAEGKDPSEV